MTEHDNDEDLTTAYMAGRYDGRKDAERQAQALSAPTSSTSDTRRIDGLLSLGDIYTAAGFPLSSREEIDLHIAYRQTPQTANDPDEEYPCW